jgi:hypothetical protein
MPRLPGLRLADVWGISTRAHPWHGVSYRESPVGMLSLMENTNEREFLMHSTKIGVTLVALMLIVETIKGIL